MLAAAAAASGVAAVVVGPGAGASPRVTGVATAAVLSPRRLPQALTGMAADARLAQQLDNVLADPSLGPAAAANCMSVAVGADIVYTHAPQADLLPASNLKLLTAFAVLTRLPARTTLSTEARSAHPPVNGVIEGPLWLVGGGDPMLVTDGYRASQTVNPLTAYTWASEPASHLETLADSIKAAGVRRIAGGVLGDDSRYDEQRSLPSWKASYLADGEIGSVGVLTVNGGFQNVTHHVAARSPAAVAAGDLAVLLAERGIQLGGPPGAGTAPPGSALVATLPSLPVGQIVKTMLLESDNLSAEMLTKELGRRFGGAGTWPAGMAVLRNTLAASHLPLAGFAALDGSGLDRGNRSRCATLLATLMTPGPATGALRASLPVAARDGTLVHRMVGQPPAGRLRAKTGSLTGVAALSGLVDPVGYPAAGGPEVSFSLLANDLRTDAAGVGLEDRVAAILASYPQAPPAAGLAPPGSAG